MRKTRKWISHIKTGNGMIVHMEEKSEPVAAHAQIKDDIKQTKMTCVHQGYLVVQLGLKTIFDCTMKTLWHVCFLGHI